MRRQRFLSVTTLEFFIVFHRVFLSKPRKSTIYRTFSSFILHVSEVFVAGVSVGSITSRCTGKEPTLHERAAVIEPRVSVIDDFLPLSRALSGRLVYEV